MRATMALAALCLAGCAANPAGSSMDRSLQKAMNGQSQMEGRQLDAAVQRAERNPLGSKSNPVRAQMPPGEIAYLRRLRCGDGTAPTFSRMGSFGDGPYGNIIDGYQVDCGSAAPGRVQVFMDMYHPGFIESRPVPGVTIR